MSDFNGAADNSRQFKTLVGVGTEVPISVFLDTLLPSLRPGIDLDALIYHPNGLGRILPPITKDGHLWGYSTKNPSDTRGSVAVAFKNLEICARRIPKTVEGLEQRYEYRNHQRGKRTKDDKEDSGLPDAYFLRMHDDSPVNWSSISASGVYSKEKNATTVTEITELMSECMYRDPRRRFTYGFTVEDTSMCLWYSDRSQILASEPFNFILKWRILFHFVLSIAYAEPHEVGFDSTMTLIKQEDRLPARYNILVRSETGEEQLYRTLELLHEQDAEYLVGRGTRVWKAVKIENSEEVGEPVVLKDAWVDHYREREGYINARVRKSAIDSVHRDLFDAGLLTILSHGDVFVAGLQDRTPLLPRNTKSSSSNDPVGGGDVPAISRQVHDDATQDKASGDSDRLYASAVGQHGDGGSTQDKVPEDKSARAHDATIDRCVDGGSRKDKAPGYDNAGGHKSTAIHEHDSSESFQPSYQVHYRIVFKEVGKPLGTISSLFSVFKALREVTYTLQGMHACGWVHCDVSAGNILVFDEWAKIADLEYAAQKDERKKHDGVATRLFVAEEVRKHLYLFRPMVSVVRPEHQERRVPTTFSAFRARREAQGARQDAQEDTQEDEDLEEPLFRYNPLHDLESVWWVAVYFLVTREVTKVGEEQPSERSLSDINAQQQWASDIFWHGDRRFCVMRGAFYFRQKGKCLHPSLHPLMAILDKARRCLVSGYTAAEENMDNMTFDLADGIHGELVLYFDAILDILEATSDIQVS